MEENEAAICVDCGAEIHIIWNGGRCFDCHNEALEFPYGQDEDYAGERWDDDY